MSPEPDPIAPGGNGHNGRKPDPPANLARGASLTPTQLAAAWHLACGDTWKVASTKAKVDIRTIGKWMHVQAFKDAIAEGTEQLLSICAPASAAARVRMSEAAPEAAQFVVDTLRDDKQDVGTRMKAADRILDAVGIGGKAGTQVNVGVAVNAIDETYSILERRRSERGEASPR